MCFNGVVDVEVDEADAIFDDEIDGVVNAIVDGISSGVFILINVNSFTTFNSFHVIDPFCVINVLHTFNIFDIINVFNCLLIISGFPLSSISWSDNIEMNTLICLSADNDDDGERESFVVVGG